MGTTSGKLGPDAISDLTENTNFTEEEIRHWYKEYCKDFPSGQLSIDQFKDVYIQHFPNGDATKFAEHVFRTFDTDKDHMLDFREFMVALSVMARGEPVDKLQWAFQMYDIDNNGYITKDECTEIIKAMYKLLKSDLSAEALSMTPKERTESIFKTVDINQDQKISKEEFINGANMDPVIMTMLKKKSL